MSVEETSIWLNGVRVAAANFPDGEEPLFASEATRSHSAGDPERFDLTPFVDLLRPGENLLAMVVLNSSPTSNDLILYPQLGTVPPALHTNFRIDSAGGSVLLVDTGGRIADAVDIPVTVTRTNGFEGEIEISLSGLPDGITAAPVKSLAKGDTSKSVTLKLEIAEDHQLTPGGLPIRILGRAWVRVLWRAWVDRKPYDPALHGAVAAMG